MGDRLPRRGENVPAATAFALAISSVIPLVGLLLAVPAIILAGFGLRRSHRLGGRRASIAGLTIALATIAGQVTFFCWIGWLLRFD